MPPIRLLIADDSSEFRKSVGMMLGLENDIQVVAMARDGEETVDFGRQFRPDVAVIDIHMPKMDGIAAIRSLMQVSPGTACMIISYEKERETLRQAMAAGARDYLIKPFSTDELINAVRRLALKAVEEREKASAQPAPPAGPPVSQPLAPGLAAFDPAGGAPSAAPGHPAAPKNFYAEREKHLIQLAQTFLKTWRMDDEALRVYVELVTHPKLDPDLLTRLAAVFLARRDWRRLREICDRMEKPTPLK